MNQTTMILAGPDEGVLTRSAYPAFNRAGIRIEAIIDTPDRLRDVMATTAVDLAVIEANIVGSPDEALALLSDLGDAPIAVILPVTWKEHHERFKGLPNLAVRVGLTRPVNWPDLAAKLPGELRQRGYRFEKTLGEREEQIALSADRQAPQPAARLPLRRDPESKTPTVRVGLYGSRGGVGVSTAALAAAQAVARAGTACRQTRPACRQTGQRVALFDSRGRGDLHLMAGLRAFDAENPVVCQGITLFPCAPTAEMIRGFDAVVVDGGRERGELNADWRSLDKPLSGDQVRALVGLAPLAAEGGQSGRGDKKKRRKPRVRDLGGLISIEVTG